MTADPIGGKCRASVDPWAYPLLGTLFALTLGGGLRAQSAPPAADPTLVDLPPLNVTGTRVSIDRLDRPNATATLTP